MFFTNLGKCHWIKVYELPEGGRNSRSRPINERHPVGSRRKSQRDSGSSRVPEGQYVFFATAQGIVKNVQLSAFKNVRAEGIKAIALKEGDYLVGAAQTGGVDDIMLFSNLGKAIRFSEYWEKSGNDEAEDADIEAEISDGIEDETADD